jgi:hypothetical protein
MRNYLKYRAAKMLGDSTNVFPPVINAGVFAFGNDDSECLRQLESNRERLIAVNNPARTWEFHDLQGPLDYYFKLDKKLIYNLLFADPAFWWDNFISPDASTIPNFPDNVETVSPRATFPTKLGTDGQRLRSGRSKDVGAALNYIGKLYFLTSKTVFKTIWTQLNSNKITAKEALAQANALI